MITRILHHGAVARDRSLRAARIRPQWRGPRAAILGALLIAIGTSAGALTAMPASASTQLNCAANPSACGYPDATNTGVPAGTVLKNVPSQVSSGPGWTYDATNNVVQVTGANAVLSGLSFPCTVNVKASGVTITSSKITTQGQSSFGVSLRHANNVTISDTTITGVNSGSGRIMAGIKDIYADSSGTQVLRDNIIWTDTGVQLEGGLVQDTYIHDMGYLAGDHVNGVTSNGGSSPPQLTIRHNTIFDQIGQTDAVGLFEDFGVQANRTIDSNLLAGGSYTIYGGQNTGGPPTYNIRITNNRISTIYFPKGGYWGPATAYSATGTGNTWSGNVWDSTGAAIPHP